VTRSKVAVTPAPVAMTPVELSVWLPETVVGLVSEVVAAEAYDAPSTAIVPKTSGTARRIPIRCRVRLSPACAMVVAPSISPGHLGAPPAEADAA
jgi:hypothetical protein